MHHVGWKEVAQLTSVPKANHAEKRLLAELRTDLAGIVRMQNQTSNLVFVVSLGSGTPPWSSLSWTDIVNQKRRYFHPVGKGWSKVPPNYMGFRYGGRLQSIHHVKSWKIVDDIHEEIPELSPKGWPAHFLYTLGPPIVPPKTVKNGKVFPNGRVWAMLDLLLTSDTVSDARDLTQQRLSEER